MRYRLRTLLILLAIVPPLLGVAWRIAWWNPPVAALMLSFALSGAFVGAVFWELRRMPERRT